MSYQQRHTLHYELKIKPDYIIYGASRKISNIDHNCKYIRKGKENLKYNLHYIYIIMDFCIPNLR